MQEVVLWSGGLDSTNVLAWVARASSQLYPVCALTIDINIVNGCQQDSQHIARERFLEFACKKGWHIRHNVIKVDSDIGVGDGINQAHAWQSIFAPFIQNNSNVYLGYMLSDSYWHIKHLMENAWDALFKSRNRDVNIKIIYPLEWDSKEQILRNNQVYNIPDDCWWSCDRTEIAGVPCGKCEKCMELIRAYGELRNNGRIVDDKWVNMEDKRLVSLMGI